MQLLLFCFVSFVFGSGEPNPPNWPSNVYIFDPSTPGHTQGVVDQAFSQNGGHNPPFNGQFSSSRYAFLFKPGSHNVVVNVGFYTQVMGLGQSPSDVNIATVKCENGDFNYQGGALDNFWRSAENFASGSTLWAVSQASPLRRINVNGDLNLFQYNSGCCAGYASGGYLADSIVTGQIVSGSQQQWFTRNTRIGRWNGGVWNMVFVGNNGSPGSHCGDTNGQPFTTVAATPVIAEKPFITVSGNSFQLRIPPVEFNKVGTSNYQNVPSVDFANVFVARPSDSYSTINQKLASGLHVILSPGIYQLSAAIRITRPNTVVLGLGFPTLETTNGDPCIIVSNVDGVRISGILLQASRTHSPSLLQWGTGGYSGNSQNPGFAHDLFARVGGTNNPSQYQVSTDQIVQINSGNVVIDNAWLWRADHDISGSVYGSMNPSKNGLVVNGDSVTTYGLAIEHNLQDQLVWNGERGRTYFYQSELPYDVNQANFGNPGYAGYRVGNNVQNHMAFGAGVYCFFRDYSVVTPNGIVTPSRGGVMFVNSMTKFLNGNGGINHVINGKGDAVHTGGTGIAYVCQN